MPEAHSFLDYVFGPVDYPVWWIVGGIMVLLLGIGFVAGVFVWTLPIEVLRRIPVVRTITFRVLTFKFGRSLDRIAQQHEAGDIDTREACHQVSRVFRLFVALRTGSQVREMTASDVALYSALAAPALRVLELTYPGQFSVAEPQVVSAAVAEARKVVAEWV